MTVTAPTDSSPGAMSENDTTALAGNAEMSIVPAVKVLAPTVSVSVNIAPVTPINAVVTDALKKRASPSRRGRLYVPQDPSGPRCITKEPNAGLQSVHGAL